MMIWLPLDELDKQRFANDDQVVVIMGRGHSGTRVMTRICETLGINVGASSELHSGDTADLRFTRPIKKIATHHIDVNYTNERAKWLQKRFDLAAGRYYKRLQPSGLWGWKFPESYLIAPYIHETFPNAKFIHLLRDGRDLAFKNHLTDDPSRELGRVLLKHIDALKKPHYLQSALSWQYQVDGWQAFADRLEDVNSKIIDFRFEDLLEEPRDSIKRLTTFLDIPMTDACENYVTSELDRSKAHQHLENDAKQIERVMEEIGETLKRYGYI